MVASASAAPPAAAPGRSHPTYTNMITHALAQLGGASARSAIAGFISASFTGLPVSHDALLTAHLRRLVAEGVLCTSGFSFVFTDHSPTRPAEAESNTDLDSDDESAGDDDDDDDDDDAYTPLLHLPVRVPVLGEKRGRGRPRKTVEGSPANAGGVRRPRGRPRKVMVMLSAHTNTTSSAQPCPAKGEPTVLSSQRDGVTKRGRGRPRKIQQSPSPSPGGDPSTACIIKRGPGRPRKEDQQSEATKHLPTPPASRGFKVGCGRPMLVAPASASADTWPPMSWRPIIIDKLPPARCSVDPLAESTRVKRPRGRPRIYTPSAAMSAETGDPETVDAASMGIKRGHGWPIKENPSAAAAMLAETEAGDAASMGIKRGRGRPRKEKPVAAAAAAAMLAETEAGDAASAGIKRGRGRPRKEKPAAAAMLAETEAGDAVSTGIKRGSGRPRKEKPAAAAAAAAAAAMLALL